MEITIETIDAHINDLLIPHTAFNQSIKLLTQMYNRAEYRLAPSGFTLLGPSGSGKTTVLNCLEKQHPAKITPEGLVKPILMVTVPATPTIRELITVLLDGLGAPHTNTKDTVATKTKQLKTLVKNCGVKMIILEEYQHFVIRGDKRLYEAADWLKVFLDETKVLVVVSGLPEARLALDMNVQLARRFSANIMMPRFDWNNVKDRQEFKGILHAFQVGLNEIDFPSLHSDDMSFRFYIGTGGLISNIKKILQEALYRSLSDNRKFVTMEDLAETWELTMKHPSHETFNPFLRDLNVSKSDSIPTLLAFAQSIGLSASYGRVQQ